MLDILAMVMGGKILRKTQTAVKMGRTIERMWPRGGVGSESRLVTTLAWIERAMKRSNT
jgi:hypothetical protein